MSSHVVAFFKIIFKYMGILTIIVVQLQFRVSVTVRSSRGIATSPPSVSAAATAVSVTALATAARARTVIGRSGLEAPEVLAPPGPASVLLETLLLGSPVLEPDLDHPHVQAGVLGQLLSHVAGWLGRRLVGFLQHLHLAGRDRCPGTLAPVHSG